MNTDVQHPYIMTLTVSKISTNYHSSSKSIFSPRITCHPPRGKTNSSEHDFKALIFEYKHTSENFSCESAMQVA